MVHECYLDKKGLIKAFEDCTFEDVKKYYPNVPSKEYISKFKEIQNNEEKKESLFRVTAFLSTLNVYFHSFLRPWRATKRDKCFNPEIIDETFDKIEVIMENKEENTDFLVSKITEHGKATYLYLVAKDFLKSIDEIYFRAISDIYPILTFGSDSFDCNMVLRFNGLSIRGGHRAKLWDTFIVPRNMFSQRATPGRYYNLSPEYLSKLDEVESVKEKVNYVMSRRTGGQGPRYWLAAIHPHISNSDACYGGWRNKLQISANNGFAGVFAKQIRGFLQTWTASSPFWNMNYEYRQTYRFSPIKRRQFINWGIIDSQWITREFGLAVNRGNFFTKLISQEKHLKGYYTREYARKAIAVDRLRNIQFDKVIQLMSRLNYEMYHDPPAPWQGLLSLYREGWRDTTFRKDLIRQKRDNMKSYYWIFDNLLHRLRIIVSDISTDKIKNFTYEEVNSLDENVSWHDMVTLKEIIESFEKSFTKTPETIEDLTNENLLMLEFIENSNNLQYHVNRWLRLSYEFEIKGLNNIKERYIDAIKHISSDSEQAELFPQEIQF